MDTEDRGLSENPLRAESSRGVTESKWKVHLLHATGHSPSLAPPQAHRAHPLLPGAPPSESPSSWLLPQLAGGRLESKGKERSAISALLLPGSAI